jgi:hypothetical protein
MPETLDYSPYDWPEDFPHENGNYMNKCCDCGETFFGHKRRMICKFCHEFLAQNPEIISVKGVLYRYGEAIGLPEADQIAQKYGLVHAEQLANVLQRRQDRILGK